MNITPSTRTILVAIALAGTTAAWRARAAEPLIAALVRPIADSVTSANPDAAYKALLDKEHKAQQTAPLADTDWLKTSGYDFAVNDNQDAGIKVLSPFTTLPRWQLERSDMAATEINHEASPAQQEHALFDADAIAYLYFIPEAFGPNLGDAFLRAYEKGVIG